MENLQKSNHSYRMELASFDETIIDEYEVCQLTVIKNGERLEELSVWGEDPSNGEFEPFYVVVNEEDYTLSDLIQVTTEVTQAIEDYVKGGEEFKFSIQEGINYQLLDEMNWSNYQNSDVEHPTNEKLGYENVEGKQPVSLQYQEDKQFQDAEVEYVSTPGIYSDSQKEEVYQVENIKSTEVKTNDEGATIQEVKTTPNVDRRYIGKDEVVLNEKQEEDKKREEARRRYIMRSMDGRDY
ncbi:hypothetical protein CON22_17800 [Bacillus cereus]|nr:hypothetical protein CON22_17800 [Bacillus cereus]